MNIREYIESGTIELYVMNVLSEAEKAEVQALARQYPDIQAEIEEVQSVMQLYAQAHAIEPNQNLKNKILDEISSTPKSIDTPSVKNIKNNDFTDNSFNFARIAPWAIAASLAFSTLYFYNKYDSNSKALKECTETQSLNDLKNKKAVADIQFQLDILKSPTTKEVILNGLPISPASKVTIFWNAEKQATYLTIQNLPKPNADKQYQLWAIVNKKPVSAGVIDYNLADLQPMKGFETAEAFAITLEPQGGSGSPTLDKMYVLGTL